MATSTPTPPTEPTLITSKEDFDALLKSSTLVITDFFADGCGPCKAMEPIFKSHAAKHSVPHKLTFAKINIDTVPKVASDHRVTTIPTFIFFKDGVAYEDVRQASPPKLQTAVMEAIEELERVENGIEKENALARDIEDEDW